MKHCSLCKELKDFTHFHKCTSKKDGFQSTCKECHKKRMTTPKGKLRNRKSQLKRKYGLSLLAFESISKQQSNSCAICKLNVPLCVDHDHKTGDVRGLLCAPCNKGLGMFKDSPELLIKAVDYLQTEALNG